MELLNLINPFGILNFATALFLFYIFPKEDKKTIYTLVFWANIIFAGIRFTSDFIKYFLL